MAATGELIRLINYVDDITATLRRITASLPGMEVEERQKLGQHLRNANTSFMELVGKLEKP